jgi:hypothetical protein
MPEIVRREADPAIVELPPPRDATRASPAFTPRAALSSPAGWNRR